MITVLFKPTKGLSHRQTIGGGGGGAGRPVGRLGHRLGMLAVVDVVRKGQILGLLCR